MKHFFSFILLVVTTQTFAAANITARLSHNPVSLDESFHLVYEADSDVDGEPDFSVLTNDFEILSSSQSTNMRSINGQWSLKKSWDLVLISKQAGIFTIPPVPFGNDASPSVRVTVSPSESSTEQGSSGKDAYFLEVSTDRRSTWVQSEIVYTVRLFSSIKINRPTLSEPETSDPDAIIEQLGQVVSYQKLINNMPYSVSELRFAVYPQHSGKLTFKPIVFEGRVPTGRRANSLFDQFMQSGTLKRMRSRSISVEVKPRPAAVPADDWLPAEKVTIEEDWSEDISQLRAGEPVTRTLTIRVEGQTAEQLDDIAIAEIDAVKQYPDKALVENEHSRDGITGSRQIKVAMIPTRAGRFTVPAIRIPWWNTRSGKQETATLPETVIEATGMAASAPATPAIERAQPQLPADGQVAQPAQGASVTEETSFIRSGYWPWVSLGLAVGWIATVLLLFKQSRRRRTPAVKPVRATPILPLERAVEKACHSADPAATKQALLAWASVRWPEHGMTSLADIARASPAGLSAEINVLNRTLYSADAGDWDPRALLAAFHAFIAGKRSKTKPHDSILEPLYKT